MIKSLSKGTYVKITNTDGIYKDSDEVAKELGSTDKLNKKSPRTGSFGDVIDSKDGYVLVDFGEYESLIDVDSLEASIRPTEIKFIVRFVRTGVIEEFSSYEKIQERLASLISEGHAKMDDEFKVYEVSGSKSLRIKLDIFLD